MKHYMDSSLTNYRIFYARLGYFMEDHSIKEYSPAVGEPNRTNPNRAYSGSDLLFYAERAVVGIIVYL